jgi:hypothetical protein
MPHTFYHSLIMDFVGTKKNGVKFTIDPVDFSPTVRIAFIEAPDGVSIDMDSERIPRHANGVTAWVSERTTIIDTFFTWKIPCTLVQGVSIASEKRAVMGEVH